MGIRFYCPNGHKLNVKAFLAGKRGICPHCDARFDIPYESRIPEDAPRIRPEGPSAAAAVAAQPPGVAQAVAEHGPATTYDPIAEAPDAVWYVRPPAGGQYGPARGAVMRQWIDEGRVSPDSMVWREGWPDWKTAGPLFPSLSPPSADFAPAPSTPGAAKAEAAPRLSAVEPIQPRSASPAARARGTRKSIAAVVCLGLLIMVLLVVLVMVLRDAS